MSSRVCRRHKNVAAGVTRGSSTGVLGSWLAHYRTGKMCCQQRLSSCLSPCMSWSVPILGGNILLCFVLPLLLYVSRRPKCRKRQSAVHLTTIQGRKFRGKTKTWNCARVEWEIPSCTTRDTRLATVMPTSSTGGYVSQALPTLPVCPNSNLQQPSCQDRIYTNSKNCR